MTVYMQTFLKSSWWRKPGWLRKALSLHLLDNSQREKQDRLLLLTFCANGHIKEDLACEDTFLMQWLRKILHCILSQYDFEGRLCVYPDLRIIRLIIHPGELLLSRSATRAGCSTWISLKVQTTTPVDGSPINIQPTRESLKLAAAHVLPPDSFKLCRITYCRSKHIHRSSVLAPELSK